MTFELLSVGTELLLGSIVNTNARYLSRRLSEMGFDVYYTTVVGDNPARLKAALSIAAERADAVITTGGLGPTEDDLTKETIAEYCSLKCVTDEESKRRLISRLSIGNRHITENNYKQADMPEGCVILPNDNGTAPGAIVEHDSCIFIMLPGPPREMEPMFENSVKPYLQKFSDCIIKSRSLRVFGLGESAVDDLISDIIKNSVNPTVAPYAKTGQVELRLTAKANTEEEAERLLDPVQKSIEDILGDKVYGVGLNNSLENVAVGLLREHKLTVTCAESCTGGLIAEKLTRIPGSSECFECSYVTYSNEKKSQLIGVSPETLRRFGAVSRETALEMSKGARRASGADIAVAVTGIAGPGGGSAEKPVGLVYISICAEDCHEVYEHRFVGDRYTVRERSSLHALDLIRRYVLSKDW